jgi:succinoglycan biosynthesis transport protein ExoP
LKDAKPNHTHSPSASRDAQWHENAASGGLDSAHKAQLSVADMSFGGMVPRQSSASNYPTSYLGGDDEESIDLRAIWAMLRRRKYILLAVFLVVTLGTVAYSWTSRPIYQTEASILVDTTSAGGGTSDDLPVVAAMMGATRARSLDTQIEVLKSGPVVQGAMSRLAPKMRSSLKQFYTMTIAPARNTDVISIAVTSYSPEASAALANAMCEEYMQQNQERNRQQVHTATNYVREQLQLVRTRLDKSRRDLLNFKQTNNTVDLSAESQEKITRLSQAQNDLRQAQAERVASIAQLNKLRELSASESASKVVPNNIVRRPSIEAMKTQLTQLEITRLSALEEYNPESTKIKVLEGQIASLKRRLEGEAQTEVGSWQVNPLRQSLTQDIVKLQGQIWALESRSNALQTNVSQARTELARVPSQEYRLGQLSADTAALQQTYQMLNEKYQSLRISEAASLANASILDLAKAPLSPISPRKMRNLLVAFILSLILGIALAALTDRLDDRVHSEEDAERASGLTTLAYVPYIKDAKSQSLLDNFDKASPLLESHRMLRTNLEFSGVDDAIRCVAVTSSQPNEGKSTSSVDLAIVMAMDGKKVILVDVDLRRPSLHRMFDVPNKVGFTNVVAGTSSLEEALQETSVPGLWLLSSGPIPPNPPELLNSKAGRVCIEKIRESADFVVLDTPPALVMSDARIVASIAGAVLLVVSVKEASTREIARTSAQLVQTGTRVLGVILNKITEESGGYYGYYYYRNYSNYVSDEEGTKEQPGAKLQKVKKS